MKQQVQPRITPVRSGGRADVVAAATRTAPMLLGILPLGLAFGLLVVHLGLPWWWATVFSTVVFAGSVEFLLVAMVAVAAPLSQIALTTFVVNSRHVFYALSFPLHRVQGRVARTYSTFALTDEAYAVTTAPESRTCCSTRIVALQLLLHVSWVTGATVGAVAGTVVSLDSLRGLDFALTALFLVLAIDAYRARPHWRLAVVAGVCVVGALILVPGQPLLVAYSGFTAVLVGRFLLRQRIPAVSAVGHD